MRRHLKNIYQKLYSKYLYKIYWYIGDLRFKKWIKYARKHNMYITITREYLDKMEARWK